MATRFLRWGLRAELRTVELTNSPTVSDRLQLARQAWLGTTAGVERTA